MIPVSTYKAKATGGEWAKSPDKGTRFVRVPFRVEGGEHAGAIVVWDGYFTEKTTERTVEALEHCGCTFPGGNLLDLVGIDSNCVDIVTEHEPYVNKQGEEKIRERVKWVNGGAGLTEEMIMSEQEKKQFAASMKGMLLARGKKKGASPNGRAAAAPRNTEGGYEPDEDDPFAP